MLSSIDKGAGAMSHLIIFSAIFLLVSGFSLTMGYYAFSIHAKSTINRLFLVLNLCMAVWALGFSVVIIAPDEASAALWTSISAVGYVLLYSVLLHFTLALTGAGKLLKKRWIYLLIYAPAAICLYAFVISPDITSSLYHFELTKRGWTRTTPSSLFDDIFLVYFVGYVLLSLVLIWLWRRRSASPDVKKQGTILLVSIGASMVLGFFTDIANGVYFNLDIPKMAPLLFLITLGAIFFCIKRYHLMRSPLPDSSELILTDNHRRSVYHFASVALITGGILMLVIDFSGLQKAGLMFILLAGVFPIVTGSVLHIKQKDCKDEEHLELLLVLTSLIVVPVLMIELADFGGLTVWALPVIIIISSLVFNMRLVLFSTASVTLLGQFYIWGISPENYVVINYGTYIGRITILLFITVAAYCVHFVYRTRLRENGEQTRMQSLLNRVSSSFAGINADNVIEKKRALMDTLAQYFGAARVAVLPLSNELAEYIPPLSFSTDSSELPSGYEDMCMQRWQKFIDSGAFQAMASARPPRPSNAPDFPWLFIPIIANEQPVGFMQFESANPNIRWTKEHRMSLNIISRIVSGALEKASGERRIRFMAYYDSLTGLPNRQLFNDRAEQAIHLARRAGRIVGVMFIDLDSFKSINDTLGHEGGDQLIKAVSEKLSSSLRKSDTVARFGGDEFLVLLNSVGNVDDITLIGDKIIHLFKDPVIVKGQELFITASAGISVFPADGEDAESLIKHADIAMYTAKEKGKNQYMMCSVNMKELVQYKMTLTNQLYRALGNDEFVVYYQPQVCLQTGKIVGVEALLRWFHPQLGLISPTDFIPLAEQTGLINSIGHWVLKTACAQSVAWKQMGFCEIRMSVNLSVVQLRSSSLVGYVRGVIEDTGIDPTLLELEVTESATTREPDYIVSVLNDLKELGISISIDDFGTEYSSLNRLKMLPIDRLKMDIQFVHGIDKSPKDQAITTVIINLAKNLDLKLVAEGVESTSQLDFLKQRMCDEVQGFYYYRPMPAEEIEKILTHVPK
jgi:diguanylate cyclase (GGDEF)-like protein